MGRERIALDLRGLGPAIRAHAKIRGMTVSAVARLAVVKMLEEPGIAVDQFANANLAATASQSVKVTVRVPKSIAKELALRSRAAGLSRGGYLSTLIIGAPVLPLRVDRQHAVTALVGSTDQLALVAADLSEFARLAQEGAVPSADQTERVVVELAREVRVHLGLVARLIAELQPVAASRRAAGHRIESSGRPS